MKTRNAFLCRSLSLSIILLFLSTEIRKPKRSSGLELHGEEKEGGSRRRARVQCVESVQTNRDTEKEKEKAPPRGEKRGKFEANQEDISRRVLCSTWRAEFTLRIMAGKCRAGYSCKIIYELGQ